MSHTLFDMYTLGIDIGGTHLRIGLVDREIRVHEIEKHLSGILISASPVKALAEFTKDYLARYGVQNEVKAVCVGFPATVNKSGDTVLNAPSLKGFDSVNVKAVLEQALCLPVFIEKDVNLLLLCDLREMSIRERDVIGVYVGTGLGNAIMLDGRLIKGSHGVAGELGHIPFGDDMRSCGCGNMGCCETVVAGQYLSRLCATYDPATPIAELFARHGTDAELVTYVERLSRVIAAEVNVLDPACLILGGGVITMWRFPREELCARILSHVRKPLPHDNLNILFSQNADTCGVLGAGIYAWNMLDGGQYENCNWE